MGRSIARAVSTTSVMALCFHEGKHGIIYNEIDGFSVQSSEQKDPCIAD